MENTADSVIAIQDLKKTFKLGFLRKRSVEALKGISLEVARGSAVGFLGPNGAGKTTTIKILTGLIFGDAGKVTVLGGPPERNQTRARLGYLPENPSFHDHLTGEEVLHLHCDLLGVPGKAQRKRIAEVLETVGLTHAADLPVRRYSKGMGQRLGIALAIVHDPELLILDEPMSGLDPVGRRDMKDLILDLRHRGKTIFFSTHIISDVEEICDRVAILVSGSVVRAGPVGELLGAQAGEIEVVASQVPIESQLAASQNRASTTTFVARDRVAAREIVEKLWAEGAQVVSMNVRRYKLEDVFLEAIKAAPERGHGVGTRQ